MRRNSTTAAGALHPVLFMLLVYIISVVLAFFVCRMIYASIHGDETGSSTPQTQLQQNITALK